MHYIIYIDVLFVVNFAMDYLVLSITEGILYCTTVKPLGYKTLLNHIKRILAAILGALWSCILLWCELFEPVWNIITVVVIGPIMILIILGKTRIRNYARGVGTLYLVTFVTAGTMHWIYYYTAFGFWLNMLVSKGHFNGGMGMSGWMLIVGIIISQILIRWYTSHLLKVRKNKDYRYTVVIEHKGRKVSLIALCDTGNGLIDPIYRKPVNVVETSAITELIDSYDKTAFHLIPYSSIGQENGLIPVVKLEKLMIIDKKEVKIIENPYIALYSGKFASNTDYRMIIHPEMLHGTKG